MLRSTVRLVALLIVSACRYEWKNELDIPSMCPPPKPRVPAIRIASLTSSGSMVGRISRLDNGNGVDGARVRLQATPLSYVAVSDSLGRFVIDSLPFRRYVIDVLRIGFVPLLSDTLVVQTTAPPFDIGLEVSMLDGPCSGLALVRVRKPWWKLW